MHTIEICDPRGNPITHLELTDEEYKTLQFAMKEQNTDIQGIINQAIAKYLDTFPRKD